MRENGHAEVRHYAREHDAEYLLRAAEVGREVRSARRFVGIAVRRDERGLPGGVARVHTRMRERAERLAAELRSLDAEPVRDAAHVGPARQEHEAVGLALRRGRRD